MYWYLVCTAMCYMCEMYIDVQVYIEVWGVCQGVGCGVCSHMGNGRYDR